MAAVKSPFVGASPSLIVASVAVTDWFSTALSAPFTWSVAVWSWTSYAPMSQGEKRGRPRWSVPPSAAGQVPPASIAGLPGDRALVGVGPLLSASGPSCALVLRRSVDALKPQPDPASRLWPPSVIGA